jgi:hypothetical protein
VTDDSRRKHVKRHTKPYVCTFPPCTSRHGSRSDWKRHEESQHAISESWLCSTRVLDGTRCFTNFSSEHGLQCHLVVAHRMPASKITLELCEAMHLGENGVGRFWCGFCKDIISQEPRNDCNPREMRTRHVGDHYDKDCAISDYKFL